MISQDNYERLTISDLKVKAKDQLLGNYQIATGSFALLFVIIYGITMIISSALATGGAVNPVSPESVFGIVLSTVISFVLSAFTAILTTGYINILRKISDGIRPVTSDLFCVLKNHPDKVMIISFILTGVQTVLLTPSTVIGYGGFMKSGSPADITGIDGRKFLLWIVVYIVGIILSLVFDMYFALSYQIYLDDTQMAVTDIMKRSFDLMRGNVLRYFVMMLSFAGYYILVILSLGIAALWVVPYQMMTTVQFYYDLRDGYHES